MCTEGGSATDRNVCPLLLLDAADVLRLDHAAIEPADAGRPRINFRAAGVSGDSEPGVSGGDGVRQDLLIRESH
jgi:hypothetical protein